VWVPPPARPDHKQPSVVKGLLRKRLCVMFLWGGWRVAAGGGRAPAGGWRAPGGRVPGGGRRLAGVWWAGAWWAGAGGRWAVGVRREVDAVK
jgi:hypothetical protein